MTQTSPRARYEQRIRIRAYGALQRRHPEEFEELREQLRRQDPFNEERELASR